MFRVDLRKILIREESNLSLDQLLKSFNKFMTEQILHCAQPNVNVNYIQELTINKLGVNDLI